jgi:hypothetical protein
MSFKIRYGIFCGLRGSFSQKYKLSPRDAENAARSPWPERHIFEQADTIHVGQNSGRKNYALKYLRNQLRHRGAPQMPNLRLRQRQPTTFSRR